MYLQNKQLWMILFSRMISASVFLGSILITYLKNTPGWCQHNSQTEVPPPTAHPLHTINNCILSNVSEEKIKTSKWQKCFRAQKSQRVTCGRAESMRTPLPPCSAQNQLWTKKDSSYCWKKISEEISIDSITLVDSFDLWYWRLQLPLLASRLVEKGFPHTVCINL